MRIIYFTLLCCAAVLPVACVPGSALRPGVPEKTFLGYRIEVPDKNESSRLAAEQQGKAFCKSENKQYVFSRLVTWTTVRLGRYVPTYNFYFVCREPQVAKSAKPEKMTPQKNATVTGREEAPWEKKTVSAGRKTPEKTVMIITPGQEVRPEPEATPEPEVVSEQEVTAPLANIPTIEARPSKILVSTVSREGGRWKRRARAAKASEIWSYAKDKGYIPGEPESLASPGEKVHPSLLGDHFIEETLGN